MSRPTPLLAALALAAVLIPAAAVHAGQTQQAGQPEQAGQTGQDRGHGPAHTAATPAPAASLSPSPAQAPVLKVQSAAVVAVPPGAAETSAWMTLRNAGQKPVVLTGARTALADHAMLMSTRRDTRGLSGMTAVKTLTVPARGTLRLEPSGDHLMLMGLKRTLKVGETVRLTLTVQGGRALNVDAVVRRP